MAIPVGPLQVEVQPLRLPRGGQAHPRVLREQVVGLDGHRGHRQAEGQGDHRRQHCQVVR